jgi:hypothetical protein
MNRHSVGSRVNAVRKTEYSSLRAEQLLFALARKAYEEAQEAINEWHSYMDDMASRRVAGPNRGIVGART